MNIKDCYIAIVGLGYVGLPLAVAFQSKYKVIGYDLNQKRLSELSSGLDITNEVSNKELKSATNLSFTGVLREISKANVYIITVPTPVTSSNVPDLQHLEAASRDVGTVLSSGDLVIYESTVYPGATEEVCVPILERTSGLSLNNDFFVGYSPERINPGDPTRELSDLIKVTSGSSALAADLVDQLYSSIITAGTYKVSGIKVAEAAKVIENIQRDVNIGLVNELAMIFDRLDVPTAEVLDAAATKWNFIKFVPGLVGGHCIGVDPYYLTYKAAANGYVSDVILAGRKTNEQMPAYLATKFVKAISRKCSNFQGKALVLGATFKEDCPDIRNSKVFDLCDELTGYGFDVDLVDPYFDSLKFELHNPKINIGKNPDLGEYAGVIVAVSHREFKQKGANWVRSLIKENGVVYDVKNVFPEQADFLYL